MKIFEGNKAHHNAAVISEYGLSLSLLDIPIKYFPYQCQRYKYSQIAAAIPVEYRQINIDTTSVILEYIFQYTFSFHCKNNVYQNLERIYLRDSPCIRNINRTSKCLAETSGRLWLPRIRVRSENRSHPMPKLHTEADDEEAKSVPEGQAAGL